MSLNRIVHALNEPGYRFACDVRDQYGITGEVTLKDAQRVMMEAGKRADFIYWFPFLQENSVQYMWWSETGDAELEAYIYVNGMEHDIILNSDGFQSDRPVPGLNGTEWLNFAMKAYDGKEPHEGTLIMRQECLRRVKRCVLAYLRDKDVEMCVYMDGELCDGIKL